MMKRDRNIPYVSRKRSDIVPELTCAASRRGLLFTHVFMIASRAARSILLTFRLYSSVWTCESGCRRTRSRSPLHQLQKPY
jgi:hypothetical protein